MNQDFINLIHSLILDYDEIGINFLRVSGVADFYVTCAITLVCHKDSRRQERYTKVLEYECEVISRFGCVIHVDEGLFNRELFFSNGNIQFTFKIITRRLSIVDYDNDDDNVPMELELCDVYTNLYKTMKYSDLIIKSSDGEELKAHKAILCTKSDVFDAMFTAEMRESLSGVINCTDLNAKVLTELIRFVYCNKVEGLEDVDIELYGVAKRYQIEKLDEICLHSVYKRLSEENAIEIAIFAELNDLKVLISCCALLIHA